MQKELISHRYKWGVVGLALLACISCARRERLQEAASPMRVGVAVVESQNDAAAMRYVGVIEAIHETPLSLQCAGRVLSVHCHEGERVQKGQVLLRIDSTQAVHAMEAAEAALRHAQDGYDRLKKVYVKGAVTDQKMVETESQLMQARSLFESAKQRVKECNLVAPCNGLVQDWKAEVGQLTVPGMRICTILDLSAFQVRFTVPETEIGRMPSNIGKANGEVECMAVQSVYPVFISEKSHKANTLSHTYEVVARIQGGAGVLMPGMVGKVRIQPETSNSQAIDIIIPARCILLRQDGPTVWVVEQGRAVRRNIAIGGYQANGVKVLEGLQVGDSLITDGYQKLYQDCRVITY